MAHTVQALWEGVVISFGGEEKEEEEEEEEEKDDEERHTSHFVGCNGCRPCTRIRVLLRRFSVC